MANIITLSEYRSVLSSYPRPTEEQINNFVDFIASSHSWYKHLPKRRPGVDFYVYLNPAAGMNRLTLENGRVIYSERTDPYGRFHYSAKPTKGYRKQFGFLDYYCGYGTNIIAYEYTEFGSATKESKPELPRIEILGEDSIPPDEVMEAGRVKLTAMIHPRMGPRFLRSELGEEEIQALIDKERAVDRSALADAIRQACALVHGVYFYH